MAIYPKYVVDKDWDSQQITDIVSYKGAGQNFTFGTDGFASIYETILDANDIAVPGAVGADTETPSPVPYTEARQTIFVVKGDFSEAVSAAANAKYTLDFQSIYGAPDPADPEAEDLRTKFVGSIVSEAANDVGIRVSSGEVFFGETAVYENIYKKDGDGNFLDADNNIIDTTAADAESKKVVIGQENTNRTTITLNRTVDGSVGQWADSEFVVGGALAASDLKTVTATVTNTDLTVANWVWVGSQNGVNETASDAVSNFLVVNDSTVTGTTLQVRHTGDLKATNSTFDFKDMILRGDATFDKTTITLSTYISNVYGENNSTATLTLKNGSTLTSTTDLQIGKPDGGDDAKRAGALVLNASSIGFATVIPDNPETTDVNESAIVITRSGNIAVKQNGSITMDAASKIYASALTNDGAINITIDAAGEDWINATSFNNTAAAGKINIAGSFDGGVKRVIYATEGAVKVADIVVTATSTDGKAVTAATRAGKVALAAGVDYTTLYLSNAINEDDDFAKEVKDTDNKSYYVDFNAFQLPKSALEEGVKDETTTILIDGTTAAALTYAGVTTASIDGLTFKKDGKNAVEATDVEKNVVFTLSGMDPTDPESYRELKKGITVGEGVTFTADKLYQSGKDAVTTINGELKMGTYNVTHEPGTVIVTPAVVDDPTTDEDETAAAVYNTDPIVETLPDTFQVAGGKVNVTSTGSLTGAGIVSVIATLRDDAGKPIKAEMNVTGAPINLSKLEIGANSTVTLEDIAPDADGNSKAVFGNVVMRKTNVSDFDGPVLTIINSQVDVTNSFDTTKGLVNINFQSQLFVKTATATIEGGTLNLTVTADDVTLLENYGKPDVPQPKMFYTIVHAAISDDVVLTCDHDKDEDGYIDGSEEGTNTKYIYTDLGGQGLFVMHEDVAKNIYVNVEWEGSKIGDVVGEGMFYGINAFENFTKALTTASGLENACTITLLSDVTENGLTAPAYELQNLVTVKGDYTVIWNVTQKYIDDGSVYFYGDGVDSKANLTFEAGTTFQASGKGPIYVGYDPANDAPTETRMDAVFAGTIQNSGVYVGRWSNLTVTGTITGGDDIYIRKHGKILIDGTERTSEDPQVSTTTTGDALIYGGTTTVLNSNVSIGGMLKVVNRNGNEPEDVPAETTVFGATNSTISAKTFNGGSVSPTGKNDLKDGVTSLVKSTMTITNGVDNYGTFYVGVAVKAKDILDEDDKVIKNTVEVDESITDAASSLIVGSTVTNNGVIELKGSTLLVGPTAEPSANILGVSNAGVITFTGKTTTEEVESENPDDPNGDPIVTTQEVVVRSTANITGELKNNAGGVITITDSTVNTSKVTNSATTDYGTINVNANGVLNVTTAGGLNNGGYGIMNVTGGTVSATHNSAAFWNYGIMNLNGAEFAFHDNIIRNSNVINVNGAVNVHDENNAMGKILANNANAKVVFGVSNTGTGAAEVKTNIQGGKVAFSADGLSFDWAVTGVTGAGTADEAIASAKLKGGTLFVDKAGITLFDTGFKVVDTAAVADDPATTDVNEAVAEVSHYVYNNTNAIEIGATGELTLDKGAADYLNPKKWSITGLKTTEGGSLTMHWTSVLTVSSLDNVGAETITIDVSGFNGIIEGDKLLIDQDDVELDMAFYEGIMTNPKGWFKIGTDENAGDLFLNAAAFAKVSQRHAADIDNGWYKHVNTQGTGSANLGAADSESPVVLVLDGKFNEGAYLNSKETYVVGGTPDPAHEGQDLELSFSKIFAGGYDVSTLNRSYGPAQLNLKVVDGNLGAETPTYDNNGNAPTLDTDVTISAGTFSNFVIGGDVVRLAEGEDKVNFFRLGDTNLTINGGVFNASGSTGNGEKQIVGGLYFYKAGGGFATITGDVNLTISGGTFEGYTIYGGNFANTKTLGKNTRIDGNVTVTLDSSDQALVFAKNAAGKLGGSIYAGSFGAGAITGDVNVILTGDEDITFEKLFGGSTGDFRAASGKLESNVEGKRILSFTGFTGGLNAAAVIDGFDTVEISGVNELNFDVTGSNFNLDVTDWKFAANAKVSGNFAFDFTGDKVDMTALAAGFQLGNVTMTDADLANVSVGAGIGKVYDAESKLFSLVSIS